MRELRKRTRRALAALGVILVLGGAVAALDATPAYADCGDTQAQWVDATVGSAWSGTMDSTTAVTATMDPQASGVGAATTVIVAQSGLGTWRYGSDMQWTASAAGIWSYRFEVNADSCSGGKVSAASGGATDAFGNVHPVTLTRTL